MQRRKNLKFAGVLSVLPERVAKTLEALDGKIIENIHEVRLRANKPLTLTIINGNYFIAEGGLPAFNCENPIIISDEELDEIFSKICEYSFYTYQDDIANGFVTMQNGNRVGIAGTAVLENGSRIVSFKNINSLNIRISREVKGAANEIINEILTEDSKEILGALVISPPKFGKTTILRDLARQLSIKGKRVALIDERNELAAVCEGMPQNDVGKLTDILTGIPKDKGILYALRNLSPEVIICDEIGGSAEIDGVIYALNAGVPVIASAHSGSYEELLKRPGFPYLLNSGAIKKVFVINSKSGIGKISEVIEVGKEND